jgi:hypothetical protein
MEGSLKAAPHGLLRTPEVAGACPAGRSPLSARVTSRPHQPVRGGVHAARCWNPSKSKDMDSPQSPAKPEPEVPKHGGRP